MGDDAAKVLWGSVIRAVDAAKVLRGFVIRALALAVAKIREIFRRIWDPTPAFLFISKNYFFSDTKALSGFWDSLKKRLLSTVDLDLTILSILIDLLDWLRATVFIIGVQYSTRLFI
jgi:hypothetical protein